jgi:hypothetical protein
MEKTKEIDLSSFDIPDFYEKLENANREAGIRPISILSQTFAIISTIIELISYIIVLATAPDIWWAVLLIIAISVPSAVINFIYRKKNFEYMRRRSKDRRQMNYYSDLLVNKDMVKEIKMYDLADNFIGRYKNVFEGYYGGMRKLILRESGWHVFLGIASSAANLLFYLLIRFGANDTASTLVAIAFIVTVRVLAAKYKWSLPRINSPEEEKSE